jgi:hypothetical protein
MIMGTKVVMGEIMWVWGGILYMVVVLVIMEFVEDGGGETVRGFLGGNEVAITSWNSLPKRVEVPGIVYTKPQGYLFVQNFLIQIEGKGVV